MLEKKGKALSLTVSLLAVIVLSVADQLFKYLAVAHLKPVGSIVLIKGILGLSYVENDGAMMGFLSGNVVVMAIISFAVLAGLVVFICFGKIGIGVPYFCLVAIISGGIGNIIDRIARGFVVDYIEFLFVRFYVFNFADMLITCACFILIFYEIVTAVKETKGRKSDA